MAAVTLDQLPPALALNGGELVWLYQGSATQTVAPATPAGVVVPWVGVRGTVAQIAAFMNATLNTPAAGYVSMRQLIAALASQGTLVTVFDNLPSDITNSYSIAWNHAYIMTVSDPFVTGFLQPTLGYTGVQMIALFAFAATFPV